MSNFPERLKEERVRLGMSQEAFGEVGGVQKGAQHNYEHGRRKPDSEYLEKIQKIGVDIGYLFCGIRNRSSQTSSFEPDMVPSSSIEEQKAGYIKSQLDDPEIASIPLYDVECAAGSGRDFEGEEILAYMHMDREIFKQLYKSSPESTIGIRVRGDSMAGTLEDGDWVFVDLSERDPSREGVYLILMDGERRVKRMQRVAGGGWLLISDNPRYDKELIAPDKKQFVEILGRCLVNMGQLL